MNLQVFIIDHTGSRKTGVEMPDDVPMRQLVPALVNQLGLPIQQGGNRIAYKLESRRIRKVLDDNDTLSSGGVREDDVLSLTPLLNIVEIENQSSQRLTATQININGSVSGSTIIIGNENEVQSSTKKD